MSLLHQFNRKYLTPPQSTVSRTGVGRPTTESPKLCIAHIVLY